MENGKLEDERILESQTRKQKSQIGQSNFKDSCIFEFSIFRFPFLVLILVLFTEILSAQSTQSVRAAVSRALPILQKSAREFVAKRACVSCHHNILTIFALDSARSRGFEIDAAVLTAVEDKTFRSLRASNALDDAIQATTLNDPTPNDSFLLMAAHDSGLRPDLITSVYARRLIAWQRDGHWVTSDFRPPHSSSFFTATATAIRAIDRYAPDEMKAERDRTISRARQWLVENLPLSTEDAAFRLMGLVWAQGASGEIAQARRDLTAMQLPGGGWPQLHRYAPDAYSTGEALFALHESGVPATDQAWTKGLNFLLTTQAKDGTWRVHTRMLSPAEVSPKYFTTGFPYGKDEYLSYAGTCWAVMALLKALPDVQPKPQASVPLTAENKAPAWMRTALFGSVAELRALLDAGLDPNSKTANGTTVLMATSADAEKVRLLLARGADPSIRASSGADALTIASAYRGTADSIRALLDAGVGADPPQNVRVKNEPIVLASMTGDLENVRLLLSRGARASEKAIGQAVTFGYPDIVRTLIAAGANSKIVESSGINLLHWATITNRLEVVSSLIEARVPINALDDNGFTPLMYAATIDFGDTRLLNALLKAGADKTIRNFEGRTPAAQARRYRHSQLEAALR